MNWNTCCHYARNLQHGIKLRREGHYDSKREAGEKEKKKKKKKKGGREGRELVMMRKVAKTLWFLSSHVLNFLNERLFMKT